MDSCMALQSDIMRTLDIHLKFYKVRKWWDKKHISNCASWGNNEIRNTLAVLQTEEMIR